MFHKHFNSGHFYWSIFWRKFKFILILNSCATILAFTIISEFPDKKLWLFFIFMSMAILFSALLSYWEINPLRHILKRMESINLPLSHDKFLQIIYSKNEWKLLQEMIELLATNYEVQDLAIENINNESEKVIESIPAGVVIIDKNKHILKANQKFYTDMKISGEKRPFNFSLDLPPHVMGYFDEALKDQKNNNDYILWQRARQFYHIGATTLFDRYGKIIGAVGIFHDVTEIKQIVKIKTDFVANISHEVRTPLTSIKGHAQYIMEKKVMVDQSLWPSLASIERNTHKLAILFEKILELSKLESMLAIEKFPVNLKSIIETCLQTCQEKYPQIELQLKLDLKLDSIQADYFLIEQLFTNLIENSFKYARKNPLEIYITSEKIDSWHIIHFWDNGIGVPENDLDRIFERFFRSKTTASLEGYGLGLSLVKHIMAVHQGKTHAENTTDAGLLIKLSFPC